MRRTRGACGLLVGVVLLAGCSGAASSPPGSSSVSSLTSPSDSRSGATSGRTGGSSDAPSHIMPDAVTVHGRRVVVTGDVPRPRLRRTVREADRAATWVTRTWGEVWHGRAPVQIYVPRTAREFRALGGDAGDQVSATTTPAGVVVLDPDIWSEVTAEGRVVVLTHELTHVALRQARLTRTPRWVIEGSAELTAYRPTGLSLAQAAPQVATQVRSGRPPSGPPADAAFSDAANDLQASYQRAYAWCLFLSDRFGLPAFTRFVRHADHGDARSAFSDAFHSTRAALADDYRAWLVRQVH